jgi:hypothetical protein
MEGICNCCYIATFQHEEIRLELTKTRKSLSKKKNIYYKKFPNVTYIYKSIHFSHNNDNVFSGHPVCWFLFWRSGISTSLSWTFRAPHPEPVTWKNVLQTVSTFSVIWRKGRDEAWINTRNLNWWTLSRPETCRIEQMDVLTAASMKLKIFWDVLPCSWLNVDRRFRSACCLHHQGDDHHSF